MGFDSWQEYEIFLFSIASRSTLRPTEPFLQLVSGALSSAVKRTERACFLLGLLFDPKYGGDMVLRISLLHSVHSYTSTSSWRGA
jgi:hypothetical protein